jgi:hypothetical protein
MREGVVMRKHVRRVTGYGIAGVILAFGLHGSCSAQEFTIPGKPDFTEFVNSDEVQNRIKEVTGKAKDAEEAPPLKESVGKRGVDPGTAVANRLQDELKLLQAMLPHMFPYGGGCSDIKPSFNGFCIRFTFGGVRIHPYWAYRWPVKKVEATENGLQSVLITEPEIMVAQVEKDVPYYGWRPLGHQKDNLSDHKRAYQITLESGKVPARLPDFGALMNIFKLSLTNQEQDRKYDQRYTLDFGSDARSSFAHIFGTAWRENGPFIPGDPQLVPMANRPMRVAVHKKDQKPTNWRFMTDDRRHFFFGNEKEWSKTVDVWDEELEASEDNPGLCTKHAIDTGYTPEDIWEVDADADESIMERACLKYGLGKWLPIDAATRTRGNSKAIAATVGSYKALQLSCALYEETEPFDREKDRLKWIRGYNHETINEYDCAPLEQKFEDFGKAHEEDPGSVPMTYYHHKFFEGCAPGWIAIGGKQTTSSGCG